MARPRHALRRSTPERGFGTKTPARCGGVVSWDAGTAAQKDIEVVVPVPVVR
jgi:hypothetical protein